MTPDRTAYQLRVDLKGVRPPIWRRVLVPADISLASLHMVIQDAMGWFNCHLHEFEIRSDRYGIPDRDLGFDDLWDDVADEREVPLCQVVAPGDSFIYTYDSGDDWQHVIKVEAAPAIEQAPTLPTCTAGRRACPPEDCGGPWGRTAKIRAKGAVQAFKAQALNAISANTQL